MYSWECKTAGGQSTIQTCADPKLAAVRHLDGRPWLDGESVFVSVQEIGLETITLVEVTAKLHARCVVGDSE